MDKCNCSSKCCLHSDPQPLTEVTLAGITGLVFGFTLFSIINWFSK